MALGTGPQRLEQLFRDKWKASRTGRADVPPMIADSSDPSTTKGVVVPIRNRDESGVNRSQHDILHFYHPEANPPARQDNGFKEERLVETVQIDVDLTDRTDHSRPAGDQRLSATDRMVGDRGDLADFDQPPYPGVLGEAKYVLETVRRGLDEWDRVSHDFVDLYLGNSNANASIVVELIQPARNTVV